MVYNKLRSEVTQHVFATFTYKRELDLVECWKRVTKDFNRFITNYRRLHRNGLGYIRTVEAHEDLYPHIHAVLQHKHGIIVRDSKWFERELYQKWRGLWTLGLSDFQAPRSGSVYPVLYIIKYISKDSTLKTLWRKFYMDSTSTSAITADVPTSDTLKQPTAVLETQKINPSAFFCHQFKIKQCTWSRNFEMPRYRPKTLLVGQSLLTPSNK